MSTQVKICGITTMNEVQFINQQPVNYVGLVFAESVRRLTVPQAQRLRAALRPDIAVCGVFVQRPVKEINDIVSRLDLDIAQVHRMRSRERIEQIRVPVWCGISIRDEQSIEQANCLAQYDNVAGVVTDAYVQGQEGGTGRTFNWNLLNEYEGHKPLILAGGLNADNVQEAIQQVIPAVVDVSSGVEEMREGFRMKSREKVTAFVRKVMES